MGADATTAAGFPAVRLLLDRASGFLLTEENTAAVVRVCRALDGMPLAIELTAARLRTVPVAVPRLRSADQLAWLSRLSAEHDNLHASLHAAIDAGDRATAAALIARIGWYWWLRGHRVQGAGLAVQVGAMPGARRIGRTWRWCTRSRPSTGWRERCR